MEAWLRGPVEEVPTLLQPVAHALIQAGEEITEMLSGFPQEKTWTSVAGMATVGFHLKHIRGVLDRLFTYASGNGLSKEQLDYLQAEALDTGHGLPILLSELINQIERSISKLRTIDPVTLTETRTVGRKQLPSTVAGLLFHSAEHTMRHTGQLLVTVNVLKS